MDYELLRSRGNRGLCHIATLIYVISNNIYRLFMEEIEEAIDSSPSSWWFGDMCPPFYGFWPSESILGRLSVKTETVDEEEVFVSIQQDKRRGRPKGHKEVVTEEQDLIIEGKWRKEELVHQVTTPRSSKSVPLIPKGSPEFYLLGQRITSFKFLKLPKTSAVLIVFHSHLQSSEK